MSKDLSLKRFINKNKKLPRNEQVKTLQLLADLLQEGFSFQESLNFLVKLYKHVPTKNYLTIMQRQLAAGHNLASAFKEVHFGHKVVASIQLSELHGNLGPTLVHLSQQMAEEQKRLKKLQQLLQYPLLLLTLLGLIMIVLKLILFPQLQNFTVEENGVQTNLFDQLFTCLSVIFLVMSCICVLIFYWYQKQNETKKLQIVMKIPFIKNYCAYTYTSYFCFEWAQLLSLGIETKEIVHILQQPNNLWWVRYVACDVEKQLKLGISFAQSIQQFPFFLPGLYYLITEGEMKGKLAKELNFYGQEVFQEWLTKLEKWLQLVQPCIFLLVGILVVSIYASILLPIYQFK